MTAPSIRVLLIDDETDYSETMGFWLMAQGYRVRTVPSGSEGILALREEVPDVVFLDMLMPGMNGIETLAAIRDITPDLPVVMVTAYASPEKKREAIRLGAAGFFSKSEDFSEAARLIKETLDNLR